MKKNKIKIFNIYIIILIFAIIFSNAYVLADDINEEETNIENIIETNTKITEEPKINSRAAIVLDRNSNIILYGKNINEKRKMASTTKIMTAICVIENGNLDDIVTISKKAAGTGGSRLGLKTNDKVSVKNLLYGLMLVSGNDSAVALAEHVGGSIEKFSIIMNNKAKQLGLKTTNFVTPHGLDNEEHYTTAYELAVLTNYALKNKIFANYVKTKNITIDINGYPKNLSNTNELLGYLDGVYGVKTGFTNGAGRCLVTACKQNNLDIISIVLGADTKKYRTQDSIKIINYAMNNYEVVNVKEKIEKEFERWKTEELKNVMVNKGDKNIEANLEEIQNYLIPINKNYIDELEINIDYNNSFEAPLQENSKIGELTLSSTNETILKLNIYNKEKIEKKDIFNYYFELFKNYKKITVNIW